MNEKIDITPEYLIDAANTYMNEVGVNKCFVHHSKKISEIVKTACEKDSSLVPILKEYLENSGTDFIITQNDYIGFFNGRKF